MQPSARRSESAGPPGCCLLQAAAGVCACPSFRLLLVLCESPAAMPCDFPARWGDILARWRTVDLLIGLAYLCRKASAPGQRLRASAGQRSCLQQRSAD